MRPLYLSIEGFMAFRDKVELNLEAQDVFVLMGPTGSGKTSILDAISFALYGETPRLGSRDLKKLIYQDVENPAQQAQVVFAFRHQGLDYRISRQISNKGHRVEADSRANADAKWESHLTGSVSVFKQWIPDLLGLNFDAFRRVLMLPQGGFDQFLKQDGAKERRDLLMNLAQLGIYEKIRQEAEIHLKGLREQQIALQGERRGIAGVDPQDLQKMQGRLEAIQGQSQLDQDTLQQREAEVKAAEQIWDWQCQKQALQTELSSHQDRQTEIEQLSGRLQQGEQLLEIRAELREWGAAQQLRQRLQTEKQHLQTEQARIDEQAQSLERLDADLAEATRLRPDWQAQSKRMQQLEPVIRQYGELELAYQRIQAFLKQLQAEYQSEQARQAQAQSDLAAAQAQQSELQTLLAELNFSGERLESLTRWGPELSELIERLQPAAELAQQALVDWQGQSVALEQAAHQSQTALAASDHDLEAAEAALASLELERDNQQHSALAWQVREHVEIGQPCPVCEQTVSVIPPLPAGHDRQLGPALSQARQQVKQAEAARRQAFEDHSQAQAGWQSHTQLENGLQTQIKATAASCERQRAKLLASMQVSELPSLQQLRQKFTHEKKRQKRQQEAEKDMQAIQAQIQSAQLQAAASAAALAEKSKSMGHKQQELADCKAQGQQVAADLQAALAVNKDYQTVLQARLSQLEAQDQAYQSLLQTVTRQQQDLQQAQARWQTREQNQQSQSLQAESDISRLEALLEPIRQNLGFASLTDLSVALPEARQLKSWRESIQHYQQTGISLKRDLQKLLDLLQGRSLSESQRVGLGEAFAQLKADMAARLREQAVLQEQISQAQSRQLRLTELAAQEALIVTQLRLYERITHDLGSRQLPDFLAKRILERVISGGSEELLVLSGERYCFELDEHEELVILDAWNAGEPRSVKTLSGGESFLASLALALALNAYLSGGIQLDSLFIDEGFGTLDAESLEKAASVVESLQLSGKCVGVITHIPELAERFETRFQVIKSENGAKLVRA